MAVDSDTIRKWSLDNVDSSMVRNRFNNAAFAVHVNGTAVEQAISDAITGLSDPMHSEVKELLGKHLDEFEQSIKST